VNILFTGASGFIGKELCKILSLNNKIWALGRTPTQFTNITSDISINVNIPNAKFSHIIHVAGKAHSYPKTIQEVKEFYSINHQGTLNLLKALESQTEIKTFIFASTVAVYGLEFGENINENHPTNPTTPYGKSKLLAENAIIEWCKKRNINYLILRLPLIAGNNPPGNLGAMKNAIKRGFYVKIKGNQAQKSIVSATDIANLLSNVIANVNWKSGIYNLTDGVNPTFSEIEKALEKSLNSPIRISIPINSLKKMGSFGDFLQKFKIKIPINSFIVNKLTSSLTFNDEKARRELNWNPNPTIDYLSYNSDIDYSFEHNSAQSPIFAEQK
jgi:nucleoside-diphosphate-sugar epimerase